MIKEGIFVTLVGVLTLMGCSILIFILSFVLHKGLPAMSLDFLTQASENFGSDGGILYQWIGTLWLVFGAAIVSLPIALGTTLYYTEYMSGNLKKIASLMLFTLNGVPSIIFGLFGYIFFCSFLNLGISWVTGVFILGIMIIPTITVSIKEIIESIPASFRESGLSLGFTKGRLIIKVLIPQSLHGMATGLLLGLARAAGETAPIMFTATTFSGVTIPHSLKEPITTLQTHILVLAQESLNPTARTNTWGTAMVLMTIVFAMSLTSLFIRLKRKGV
jgi:phosphate transport system permease protein